MPHSSWKNYLCNGSRNRCSRHVSWKCSIILYMLFVLLSCSTAEELFFPPEGEGNPSIFPEGEGNPSIFPEGEGNPSIFPEGEGNPSIFPEGEGNPSIFPEGEGNPSIFPEGEGSSGELSYTCPSGAEEKTCTCTQTEVDCTGVGLTSVPYGLGSTVQTLILKNNSISSIDSITSQYLPSLMYIDASYNSISSVDWSSFSSLTSLEELHLQMNLFFWVDISTFYGSNLCVLNVSGNPLFYLLEGTQELPLEELYIENCGLSTFGFGASTSLCKLKKLHIGGNSFSTLPANALSCMAFLVEIKLDNLGLTALPENFFAEKAALRLIDLSDNQLTGLPTGLFDGLDSLREIKLSGNPWFCDCNLIWLKVFMESLLASGGRVVDEATTYCSTESLLEGSTTITSLSAHKFFGCDQVQLVERRKRSSAVGVIPLDWKAQCHLWQAVQSNLNCGLGGAASCVYDFSSQSYSVVQYSMEVTGVSSSSACRDQCWLNGHSYFVFDTNSTACLCGDVASLTVCTDCSSTTTSSPGFCGNQYSNILGAAHMLFDIDVSISPLLPQVMTEVTFTLSGGPSAFDTYLWNFGDAITKTVLNDKSVSHTYLYPGQFSVTLKLSSSASNPSIPVTDLMVQVTVVSTTDQGQLSCPSSPVSSSEMLGVSAIFTSAWSQRVRWMRTDPVTSSPGAELEVNRECESGWTPFRGRCVKVIATAAAMSSAHSVCSNQGGQLLRFYSKSEINEMTSSAGFFTSGSSIQYYTGAEWFPSLMAYTWRYTSDKASVFRETLSDSSMGNCIALGNAGLQGVDCSGQLPYVCEKDQVICSGNQESGDKTCYTLVSQQLTWDQAQAMCSSLYTNGKLVSVPDAVTNTQVSGLASSQAWIGLRARTLQGLYIWDNGQTVGTYSNWVGGARAEPCVSIDSSGLWQPETCDNQHNFICQYFIGDEIKIPWSVTGLVPLLRDGLTSVSVSAVAPPHSVSSTTATLLPGSWLSSSGQVVRWNIHTKSLTSEAKLALQIWRPVCASGTLARPGCGHTHSLFACLTTQSQVCMSTACVDGEFFCLLSQACQPISQPCTCAAVAPINNIDCQTLTVDATTAGFDLMYTATVVVPAQTTLVKFEPQGSVNVQVGDIIGFQTEGKDIVNCERPSSSLWRHATLSASAGYWMGVGDHVNPQIYQLNEDTTCQINVVHATQMRTSSPNTLGYVTKAGDYTFTLDTSSRMQTCSVTALDEVEGLVWVYPEVSSVINPGLPSQTFQLNVEADTVHDLTVKLLKGSDATMSWNIDSGTAVSSVFTPSCPTSIAVPPEICHYDSSFLSSPYSNLSRSFPSSSSPVSINVNVTNALNSEALKLTLYAFTSITDVEFYHQGCANHTSCTVVVEVGVAHEFYLNVKVGDVETATYYEDGVQVNPSPSNMLVLPRTYTKPATHVLTVNVSNPLSWMTASLTVQASTRANFVGVTFDIFDKVAKGVQVSIEATASVTRGADITVTWSINNNSYMFPQTVSTNPLKPTTPYIFDNTGNITLTLHLEDAFEDSVSTSMVVEVYKRIDTVTLTLSSSFVTTSEDFSISISVDNTSASNKIHFGPLRFTLNWGDGSKVLNWESTDPVQEMNYQYSSAGTYNVSVMVVSRYETGIIKSAAAQVEAEDAISGLTLFYNGPKHVSKSITFTAHANVGSNVEYYLDFGDGNSSLFQTSGGFSHQYAAANVYTAVITAENHVSKRRHRLTLYAFDEHLLQIIKIKSGHCVPVNQTVAISADVAAESPLLLMYEWDFGNGDFQSNSSLVGTTTVYRNISTYTITLTVSNSSTSNSHTKRKDICVETPISGFSVQYNTPVALAQSGIAESVIISTSVVTGSNMTYTWVVDNVQLVNDQDVLNFTVKHSGTYTISVSVKNHLNKEEQTVELEVVEVISGLKILCATCQQAVYARTQTDISLMASLAQGTNVNHTWNIYGSNISEGSHSVLYTFPTAGTYSVSVIAENEVSNETSMVDIIAQDAVSGLNISANSTTVQVNSDILFQVSFSAGTNASFQWFCDSIPITSDNSSYLIQAFTTAGSHQCTVNLSNAVSAESSTSYISVLDEIKSLSINQSLKTQTGSTSLFAEYGVEYTFTPGVNTDFKTTYMWKVWRAGRVESSSSGSVFKYTFLTVDTFIISLQASNAISFQEVNITVEAEENIIIESVTANVTAPVMIFIGEAVSFQVTTFIGNPVSYMWTLDNQILPRPNSSIDVIFPAAGNFTVMVTLSNDLGSDNASILVSVYENVSGVAIQMKQNVAVPYLSKGTTLDLSSPTTTGSALIYNWTVLHVPSGDSYWYDIANISYTFNQTGAYQIYLSVKNGMSFEEDSLMLIVQGAITVLKMTWQDSVIATGSSITFSGDVNPGATDVRYTWQVAGEIRNTSTVTKQFPTAGVYKVSLTVENDVSFKTREDFVRVLDPITNLRIMDCNVVREAQIPVPVQSAIALGTNVTFTWFVEINNINTTYTTQNVSLTFPAEAFYNVYLRAQNDIDAKTSYCQLELNLPINQLALTISNPEPDYLFQNHDITFTASGNNLVFATFKWTITGQTSVISNSTSYTTSLSGTGAFTVMLEASNGISQQQVTLDFAVKMFLCQLPDVTRVGTMSRSVQRSNAIELEVVVDPKGCTEYIAMHTWTVYETGDCTGDLDVANKVDIGTTVTSSPAIVISPRVLNVGFYCVQFITGYHYTSVLEKTYYTVNVTASPLHAIIKGGNRRTVAVGSELCLDGTLSYDPDATSAGTSSLIYRWECTEGTATGGCFPVNSQNKYCYQGFNPGTYRVKLEIDAPGRGRSTAEQTIEALMITQGFVPIASLVCESCSVMGSYRVSSSHHVALSATCENCQCEPAFAWKIYEGQAEITPDSTQTSTGLNSEHLVLSKWGALKDGISYTFVVYVSCTNNQSNVGTASLILPANMPPTGGQCTFIPTEIIPLEDQVTVSCTNWFDVDDPSTLISYKIFADSQNPLTGQSQSYSLYSGTDVTQTVYLGSFTGESVVLRVMVSDDFDAVALGGQSIIQFKATTLGSNMTKTDYLQAQVDNVLSALIKQASPISLLQYAIAVGQQLNTESQKEHDAHTAGKGRPQEQSRAAIRDAVTICLSTSVPVSTLEDVQQMAYALKLLTDYSIEYLTEDSQVLIARTLETMVNLLQQIVSIGLDRGDIPTQDLLAIISNLLSAANARVYSSTPVWELGRTVTIDNFSTNFRNLRPEITSVVNGMQFVDINLDITHRQAVASAVVPLLEKILVSTLQTMMVNEESIELNLVGIKIMASRSYAKDIEQLYQSDTTQITIPTSILSSRKNDLDEVLQVIISHQHNPYTYGYSSVALASVPVQTLSFYETNGSYIQVTDLVESARVQLYMFASSMNTTTQITNHFLNESSVYDPMDLVTYKTVQISPSKSKVWQVPDVSSSARDGTGVHVQLRVQFLPNDTVSNTSSVTAYLGVNSSPTSDRFSQMMTLTPDLMVSGMDHKKYTFFRNDLTASDKLYIVTKNNDASHVVELSVGIYFSKCEYFNTAGQIWATDGCRAQEESIAVVTSCQCDHLTSFGGAGIVSITDINFADVLGLDVLTNPVVFIAIAVVFAIYIIVAILCRYLDRLDLCRISRVPLCGRNGPFRYEITVITGRYYNAGTSAHIGIKMYGSLNKGEAKHLTKPGAFQRNCRDTFLVAHDTSLGDISKVLIWHDNTGLSPSWFLSHLIVKDLQTRAKYTFLINSWLTLEIEDGVVQKTVKASDEEELIKFYSRFTTVFHGLLADLHTWLSMSNRPDHSRFTRVQRATCCLTCVYLYMFINAMWYGVFKDKSEADAPLSWNSFGWEEIIIALVSTIMTLPFLFALSSIFKKSRCKASVFQEALRPTSAQTIEIDAVCDMSRDDGSYRAITPLGDWVTAIDRESTTDSFPAPVGLKRTAPMHRGKRKGSSDSISGGRDRPPISSTGSRRELWNRDNIMQSWPHTMPPWIKQEKARMKGSSAGFSGTVASTSGAEGAHSAAPSHRSSRSTKTFYSGTKSIEESDDDLQQQLDEADAEIARSEEKRKKRLGMKQGESTADLFDSDDDWVNEGLEDAMEAAKPAPFNPRREPELIPGSDRRHSRASFTLRNGLSRKPDSAGGSKRDNSAVWRTRPSIVSSTSKSKSTLSDNHGRLRSLSTATSSQLPAIRNSGCLLPHWCVYVAYALCAQLSMLSIILVLLYGYNFGSAVAVKWILSLLISVFASILVIEPLKVLVLTVFIALFTKDVQENHADMIEVKPTVESNEQIKDLKFRPLGGFALLQAKEEGKKKHLLHTMLREVFVFTLMFALFLAIVYVNYSSRSMYITANNIHNKFYADQDSSSSSSRGLNFTTIKSVPEFWDWSETILARSLHHRELHNTESFGYLLGPARLRQIRGEIVTCPAARDTALMSVPELVIRRCVDSGSVDPDTDPYDVKWTSGGANWTYSASGQLDMYSKFGQSLLYEGGGYVQHLGQSYNDTLTILQQLRTDEWVDLLTRAVFIEFTLYNPSEDLTSCATLLVEFPISGGVLTSSSVRTEHLLRFISGRVDPLLVCQIMFFPFVVYLTVILTANFRSQRLRFLTHMWNWLDLLICLLTWTNTALYIACVVMATDKIEDFVHDQTAPAQLEEVALLHAILRCVHAFLVFLFSLKIVRQIRFSRPLYKFYTTLSASAAPLMGAFFIFTTLLLIYAQFGHLLYGSVVFGYHSFQHSVTSLFGLMGSRTNFWPMFECQRVLTHLFFITFGVFVYGLVIALCLAVLTWSYKWSRSQMTYKTTLEARDYEMIEFMIKRFKLMTGIQKQKPSFRRVKFEGLPSLPSRASSSNGSCRPSCSSPVSNSSDAGNVDKVEEEMDYCMATLLPTWDQVLQTFQKIEDLEKQEEEVTKKLQEVVKIWHQTTRPLTGRDHKMKIPNSRPIMGKPPLDPKANFIRFHSRSSGRNISFVTGRTSMTPPSTFTTHTPLGIHSQRPFNDQGMRHDPHIDDDNDYPIPQKAFTHVCPVVNSGNSVLRRGSPGLDFCDKSNRNSAGSTRSDGVLASKADVTILSTLSDPAGHVTNKQRHAWSNDKAETRESHM